MTKKVHLLLIGEGHPKRGDKNFYRDAQIEEIKKFKATQLCIECPHTELGDKACEAIRTGRSESSIKRILKKYVMEQHIESWEKFDMSNPFLKKHFNWDELAWLGIYIRRKKKNAKKKDNKIGEDFIKFMFGIFKKCEVSDIRFIDRPRPFLDLLDKLKEYYDDKVEKEEKRIERLNKKRLKGPITRERIENREFAKARYKRRAKYIKDLITESGIKRNYNIFRSLRKALKQSKDLEGYKPAVLTGDKHAEYIYERLKKRKDLVIKYVYIGVDGDVKDVGR